VKVGDLGHYCMSNFLILILGGFKIGIRQKLAEKLALHFDKKKIIYFQVMGAV
jgi:hypothetical protein